MNKEVDAALAKAIKDISDAAGKVTDFAADQIPDVLNQVLMYGLAQSILTIVFSVVTVVVSYYAFTKWSDQEDDYGMYSGSKLSACIAGGIASFIALLAMFSSFFTATKIILAPKLYLLEYAASLVK